jgi:hypothetical protein
VTDGARTPPDTVVDEPTINWGPKVATVGVCTAMSPKLTLSLAPRLMLRTAYKRKVPICGFVVSAAEISPVCSAASMGCRLGPGGSWLLQEEATKFAATSAKALNEWPDAPKALLVAMTRFLRLRSK